MLTVEAERYLIRKTLGPKSGDFAPLIGCGIFGVVFSVKTRRGKRVFVPTCDLSGGFRDSGIRLTNLRSLGDW